MPRPIISKYVLQPCNKSSKPKDQVNTDRSFRSFASLQYLDTKFKKIYISRTRLRGQIRNYKINRRQVHNGSIKRDTIIKQLGQNHSNFSNGN